MPVSSSRRIRSATAGGLRLTRRPSSAKVRRAFSWRASRRPQSVRSIVGVETVVMAPFYARNDAAGAHLPLISPGFPVPERIFFGYGSDDIRTWSDLGRPGQSALGGGLPPRPRRRPYRPRVALVTALEENGPGWVTSEERSSGRLTSSGPWTVTMTSGWRLLTTP